MTAPDPADWPHLTVGPLEAAAEECAPSGEQRSARSERSRRRWAIVRFVVGVALGLLALYSLNGDRDELVGASAELAHLDVYWVVLGVVAEAVSLLSFAALQRRLLQAGGVRVRLGRMSAVSLAGLTLASSVPAGPAVASVFFFRQYRRRGAPDAVAGWAIVSGMMFASLGLTLLAAAGVLLAYAESAGYDLIGVVFGVLVITVVVDAIVWQRRWLARIVVSVFELSRRLIGRPRRHGLEIVDGLVRQLETVRLNWRDLGPVVAMGLGNWVFDCACLTACFGAVGAPVPWKGLLLAYGAGQLAQNLPITPGGLGVVENSLTIALVAFGGAKTSTIAAVLLYRIITFWAYLPLGWLDWATLRLQERRADRAAVARAIAIPAAAAPAAPAAPAAARSTRGAAGQAGAS